MLKKVHPSYKIQGFLYGTLVVLFLFAGIEINDEWVLVLSLLYSSVMVGGIFALSDTNWAFFGSLICALCAMVCSIAATFTHSQEALMIGMVFWGGVNGLTAWRFYRYLDRAKKIDNPHLFSVIMVYLMIALVFSNIYSLIYLFDPAAFNFPAGTTTTITNVWTTMVYFSLVTLTTVGYGDITPASQLARLTCGMEAFFGTLFVAVLISRIVSLQLAHKTHT